MRPLDCLQTSQLREQVTIDASGGTLIIGSHRLEVPAGAVAGAVTFVGVLMPGKRLRLDLRANGAETHAFALPATLTLSYAGCTPPGQADVQRIRIFRERGNRHDEIGGQVDTARQTVSVALQSLSVYTLGLP